MRYRYVYRHRADKAMPCLYNTIAGITAVPIFRQWYVILPLSPLRSILHPVYPFVIAKKETRAVAGIITADNRCSPDEGISA
jgi:hypothetical protein